ncbi:MAG TPA: hypothetical protein PKD98_26525 [Anaerolineae bacterium]|nr:hypothetical protein [Anaerolineae bacterium]
MSEQLKAAIETVSLVTGRNQGLTSEMRSIAGQMMQAIEQVSTGVEGNIAS